MLIDLRDMQLVVALARHGHFSRAAEDCGLSQPAFSMRIRNLEERLGVAIVKRGNRFQGFTEQGDKLLIRARALIEDARALEQEVSAIPGKLHGTLTLGVIPTALAYASRVSARLHQAHPGIVASIRSRTSLQILQGLEDRSIDAGLTYAEGIPPEVARIRPLYDETYVLLAPKALAPRKKGQATWLEAANLPLTLLEPGMQNRRILDRQFRDIDHRPEVVAETNAFTTALVLVAEGLAATILPQALADSLGPISGTISLPLIDPILTKPICLVTPRDTPGMPIVKAFWEVVDDLPS